MKNKNKKVYYRIYKVSEESGFKPGFYRFEYNLSDRSSDMCEYSKDRNKWEVCLDALTLSEFEKKFAPHNIMMFENADYLETVIYKNYHVPVFFDDYGQCMYCLFEGKEISFGTYNSSYEEEIQFLIDNYFEKQRTMNKRPY